MIKTRTCTILVTCFTISKAFLHPASITTPFKPTIFSYPTLLPSITNLYASSSSSSHNDDQNNNFETLSSSTKSSQQTLNTLTATFLLLLSTTTATNALDMDPRIMNGDYADPFHPYCERHISVNPDLQSFHYSGTAVGPKDDPVLRGCTKEEQVTYGSRKGAFDGLIIMDGKGISAGDGIHEGVWEGKGVRVAKGMTGGGVDGIRWNDGNKWTKLDSTSSSTSLVSSTSTSDDSSAVKENKVGEYIVALWIGISILAGVKEVLARLQNQFDS